jgi:vacuolar-type H+-ATPase subunit I/STV1
MNKELINNIIEQSNKIYKQQRNNNNYIIVDINKITNNTITKLKIKKLLRDKQLNTYNKAKNYLTI